MRGRTGENGWSGPGRTEDEMRRLFLLGIFLAVASSAHGEASRFVLGPARFTLITPNLIRLQFASDRQFTDAPTLFAADRSAHFDGATVNINGGELTLDTGVIHLTYRGDGNPFGPANLSAQIRTGGAPVKWTPGVNDSQNLGGTLRTLDQCFGPVDLPNGIISRSGWAIVDDSKTPVLSHNWVASRKNQHELDWYLFGYGLDYRAALKSLAAISGPVPLPRKNLFGIWYSRYWPYTSDDYRKIVQEYSDHDFPLDNIVMDMDWHITKAPGAKTGYKDMVWTGYTWNRDLLPDAEALLKWFHQQGLFVTLNDHPADGVQPHEQMYADFMRAMGADPATKQTIPFDAGDKKYLDTFYQYTHKPLENAGVDFWWLDWQQYPFTRSVTDLANLPWLNRYNFLETSADGKRGVSFSRWGGWGDQKYPIHFSGDASTGWPMLAFEVPFTSTSGNVGCFFWTHDIGGHMGGRNEESYTRWCQFGAMSAALRSHSTRNAEMDRRPWTYPKWAEDSMRISFHLRSELFPYIYSSAEESCRETVPLLRPIYFEHPRLDEAYHNAQEYYFGDNFLVAPITTPGIGPTKIAWQVVYFPPGDGPWYDYFTGDRHEENTTAIVACPIDRFPLFVRGGVPIPMQPYSPRPATAPLDHLIVRCYPDDENKIGSSGLYEDDGQTQAYKNGEFARTKLTYSRSGQNMTMTIGPSEGHFTDQPATRSYTIELPAVTKPTSATIDAVPAQVNFDADAQSAKIEVPARPIDQAVTVIVQADIANLQLLHGNQIAADLQELVHLPIKPPADREAFTAILTNTHDVSLQPAIAALAGAAVVARNDAPYLYHGHVQYQIFAPTEGFDSADATARLESAVIPGRFTSEFPVKLTIHATIDPAPFADALPAEDSVIVPGKVPILHVRAKMFDRDCDLTVPVAVSAPANLDLARTAKASATSCENGYDPSGAIDGVADGYPNKKNEWASDHQLAGAAITLKWDLPQTFSRVALYDRPDPDDQVVAGRIVFDDGSEEKFGELANDGKTATLVSFPPKTVKWLRVEIEKTSPTTVNAGFSEIAVFK